MKAVLIRRYGGPDVLEVADAKSPMPGPKELTVEVHAASVNPIDWKMRQGLVQRLFDVKLPHVMGRDFSGVVRAVGPEVSDFTPGDLVFGIGDPMKDGTQAEYLCIAASLCARKPKGLLHNDAAALGVSGLSALAALEQTAPVQPGMKVLVHAGAGGVGHLAIQYAKHRGAAVAATASAANLDFCRRMGAAEVVDYRNQDFAARVRDCDIVLDTVGGETHARSLACLKPGGTLVYLVAAPLPKLYPRADVKVVQAPVRGGRAAIERVGELAVQNVLRPHISATFPLADAAKAYAQVESGRTRGKVVLAIR